MSEDAATRHWLLRDQCGDRIDRGDRRPALAPRQQLRRAARLGQKEAGLLDFAGGDDPPVGDADPVFLGGEAGGGREPADRGGRIIGDGLLRSGGEQKSELDGADEKHSQPIS